jgi:hypothetical protein
MIRQRSSAIGLLVAAMCTALLRAFPPDGFPWYPACPLHALTGLECPLCGGTRALASLANGHWIDAAHWNIVIAVGMPLLIARLIWTGTTGGAVIPARIAPHFAAIAIGFAVVRNLAGR